MFIIYFKYKPVVSCINWDMWQDSAPQPVGSFVQSQ